MQTRELEVSESLSGQASVLSELIASHLEPVLQQNKVGFGMFDLLSAVHATGGKATQAEVAARLGIRPPSLTEAVQSAVKKGLIIQVASEADLRTKKLRLTGQGVKLLKTCLEQLHRAEELAVQGIAKSDLEAAKAVLRTAVRNLARANGQQI